MKLAAKHYEATQHTRYLKLLVAFFTKKVATIFPSLAIIVKLNHVKHSGYYHI